MTESMGPINDRTKERLGPSDAVLVHARKALLDALAAFQREGALAWQGAHIDFGKLRASTAQLAPGDFSVAVAVESDCEIKIAQGNVPLSAHLFPIDRYAETSPEMTMFGRLVLDCIR